MFDHWAPVLLEVAEISDAHLDARIDAAHAEDRDALAHEGLNLFEESVYSTVHRLFFALQERAQRQMQSDTGRSERIKALQRLEARMV